MSVSNLKSKKIIKEIKKRYPFFYATELFLEPNSKILLITEDKVKLKEINKELIPLRIQIENITVKEIQRMKDKNIKTIGRGQLFTKLNIHAVLPPELYTFVMEQIMCSMSYAYHEKRRLKEGK